VFDDFGNCDHRNALRHQIRAILSHGTQIISSEIIDFCSHDLYISDIYIPTNTSIPQHTPYLYTNFDTTYTCT